MKLVYFLVFATFIILSLEKSGNGNGNGNKAMLTPEQRAAQKELIKALKKVKKEKQKKRNEKKKKKKEERLQKQQERRERIKERLKNKVDAYLRLNVSEADKPKFKARLKILRYASKVFSKCYGFGMPAFNRVCACFHKDLCLYTMSRSDNLNMTTIADTAKANKTIIRDLICPANDYTPTCNDTQITDDAVAILDKLECNKTSVKFLDIEVQKCDELQWSYEAKNHQCTDVTFSDDGNGFSVSKPFKFGKRKAFRKVRGMKRIWCNPTMCKKRKLCIIAKNWLTKQQLDGIDFAAFKSEEDKLVIEGAAGSSCNSVTISINPTNVTKPIKKRHKRNNRFCRKDGEFKMKGCALNRFCNHWFNKTYKTFEGKCGFIQATVKVNDYSGFEGEDYAVYNYSDLNQTDYNKELFVHCCHGNNCNTNDLYENKTHWATNCQNMTDAAEFYTIVNDCMQKHDLSVQNYLINDFVGQEIHQFVKDRSDCSYNKTAQELEVTAENNCKRETCKKPILNAILGVKKCVCDNNSSVAKDPKHNRMFEFMMNEKYFDYCGKFEARCDKPLKIQTRRHIYEIGLQIQANHNLTDDELILIFCDRFSEKYCNCSQVIIADKLSTFDDPFAGQVSVSPENRRRLQSTGGNTIFFSAAATPEQDAICGDTGGIATTEYKELYCSGSNNDLSTNAQSLVNNNAPTTAPIGKGAAATFTYPSSFQYLIFTILSLFAFLIF